MPVGLAVSGNHSRRGRSSRRGSRRRCGRWAAGRRRRRCGQWDAGRYRRGGGRWAAGPRRIEFQARTRRLGVRGIGGYRRIALSIAFELRQRFVRLQPRQKAVAHLCLGTAPAIGAIAAREECVPDRLRVRVGSATTTSGEQDGCQCNTRRRSC